MGGARNQIFEHLIFKMKRYVPAIVLILLAVGLVAAGIIMHQPDSVLHKAVRICMECVGLG